MTQRARLKCTVKNPSLLAKTNVPLHTAFVGTETNNHLRGSCASAGSVAHAPDATHYLGRHRQSRQRVEQRQALRLARGYAPPGSFSGTLRHNVNGSFSTVCFLTRPPRRVPTHALTLYPPFHTPLITPQTVASVVKVAKCEVRQDARRTR